MNKFRKNIITLLLLGIFSFSSVGYTITSLCCDHNEIEQVAYSTDACCVEKNEPSCCEEELSNDTHDCNHGCAGTCFSDYEYTKLELDQIVYSKSDYKIIFRSEEIDLNNYESEYDEVLSKTNPNKTPPILSGRTLIYSLNKPKIPYLIIV